MSHSLRVAAITGGRNVPSARFRVRQLIPELLHHNVEVQEYIPYFTRYPPPQKSLRPIWALLALVERVPATALSHLFDLVLLQRELISTILTLEPLTKRPRVLDVDDAIYLYRNGRLAEQLATLSDLVICGNETLAERFVQWNQNVTVIPTAVDTARFFPKPSEVTSELIIGWIGTSGNYHYLYQIQEALEKVFIVQKNARLRIISDRKPMFHGILRDKLEFIQWSPSIEVKSIQSMTIGIMPLADTEWARGKCSYKMLQYMACGIPVVVSPIGMNNLVLSQGQVGLSAVHEDDWTQAILTLLRDDQLRCRMGKSGREVVEENYDVEIIAKELAIQLDNVIGNSHS